MEDPANLNPGGGDSGKILDDILVKPFALQDASKGARLANYLLDIAGFYVLCFLIGIIIALTQIVDASDLDQPLLRLLFGAALLYLYYFSLESLTHRSFGKLITGTKVVKANGDIPSTPDIALRTICRLIPFEPFSFLGTGSGWHDELSKTRVVKVNKSMIWKTQEGS